MQAQKVAREISSLLWRIPRELLLLLKTNDCLRSVDHALGQVCNAPYIQQHLHMFTSPYLCAIRRA